MSIDSTREVITRYVESQHADLSMMADDVVFKNMGTGDEHRGVDEVRSMLDYVYHGAFDAYAETRNMIFADGNAVLEADFVGKHIGEFAGVPATQKDVRVPLCVTYDLENDKIKRARIYFDAASFFRQVGAN